MDTNMCPHIVTDCPYAMVVLVCFRFGALVSNVLRVPDCASCLYLGVALLGLVGEPVYTNARAHLSVPDPQQPGSPARLRLRCIAGFLDSPRRKRPEPLDSLLGLL